MANGKKSDIGTDKYFSDISSHTIFDGIRMTKSNTGFTDRLKEISENAAKALGSVYNDLEKNPAPVQFLEKDRISRLEELAEQLYEAARFTSASVRKTPSDIKSKLKSLALPSKYSIREIKQIAAELKKGVRSKTSPHKKIDDKLMELALLYNQFEKPIQRNTLGTQEYSKEKAKSVFGEAFVRSSDFHLDKSYRDMIGKQIEKIIDQIKSDVKSKHNTDEYMEYTERERIMEIAERLARHCLGNPASGLEKDLEKLRRLEDDNKVIKIDKTGWIYPVDAELIWAGGKNELKLNIQVYFFPQSSDAQIAAELNRRKNSAINGFKQWSGNYKVFNNQKVKVTVDVEEISSGKSAVNVRIMTQKELDKLCGLPVIGKVLDGRIDRSFVLGGVNLLDYQGTDFPFGGLGKAIVDWSPAGDKFMHYAPEQSVAAEVETARHEIGHVFGIGDMYADPVTGLKGVDASQYPDLQAYSKLQADGSYEFDSIMDNNTTVRNNDIEMVILAFSQGKRQNYQRQFGYGDVSQALGKGN